MSTFVVSARKYRPTRFEEVVGQAHVSTTLKNALQTGHLAHAFLFCGPRGVGKTTCARILAKVINCQQVSADWEPCNTCDSCRAFQENASFNITELDAASNNSVDAMRALIEQVRFQPQQGKYKVFIIDEVHMLSAAAFNAFLKTLEEPPPYAIFILATTEKHKILPTILSRCQIYDFRRITVQDILQHLRYICAQEGIRADDAALHIIAQKADGALRDALSIFDRMVAAGQNEVRYDVVLDNLNVLDYDYYFRVVDSLLAEDLAGLLTLFDEVLRKGFEPDIFMLGLAEHLRNLLVCKDEATLQLLEAGDTLRERYRQQAELAPSAFLVTALNLANECDLHYKTARNKRLHTELALIKMTYIQRAVARTPFEASTNSLEKKTPDVSAPAPAAQNPAPTTAPPVAPKTLEIPEETALTPSMVAEPKPEPLLHPQQTPTLRVKSQYNLGKLEELEQLLHADGETQAEAGASQAPVLTVDNLETAWNAYIRQLPLDTIKPFLQQVKLQLQDTEITAIVPSQIAQSTLREQQQSIMEFLRDYFSQKALSMQIVIQKSDTPQSAAPERITPLNDRDKLRLMQQANPAVKVLWERLALGLTEEG